MGSRSLQTREVQKTRYAKLAEGRANALRDRGMNDEQVARDPKIKRFKAKIRQISAAMARISFLDDQTRTLREKKEQRKIEAEAARAAAIAGDDIERKKKAQEDKAEPAKKKAPAGKAPAKAKPQPKKKGK
ncbi:MAG: hypothetical protein FJY85_02855 [Deltaproteobacteria bacterium]|nr:hypothetical protein [Deltaproteobacteria bacterium]